MPKTRSYTKHGIFATPEWVFELYEFGSDNPWMIEARPQAVREEKERKGYHIGIDVHEYKDVSGYEGVYSLPVEVIPLLRRNEFNIPQRIIEQAEEYSGKTVEEILDVEVPMEFLEEKDGWRIYYDGKNVEAEGQEGEGNAHSEIYDDEAFSIKTADRLTELPDSVFHAMKKHMKTMGYRYYDE